MATMASRVCAPALGIPQQRTVGSTRHHHAHATLLPAGLRSRSASKTVSLTPCPAFGGKDFNASTLSPIAPRRKFQCRAEASTAAELPGGDALPSKELSGFEKFVELLTTLFPIWVILGTLIGIYKPSAVTWLETDLFTVALGFLMLSMGLTLSFDDFRRCLRNPWTVGVGFVAQYLVKPILGFLIALVCNCLPSLASCDLRVAIPQ
jgi:hypothetical protein